MVWAKVAALSFGGPAGQIAVMRIGNRSVKNNTMIALAAMAFVAIFFFSVPFPIIILVAGIIGYLGGRAGNPAFAVGGGHGGSGRGNVTDAESALGEKMPDH